MSEVIAGIICYIMGVISTLACMCFCMSAKDMDQIGKGEEDNE